MTLITYFCCIFHPSWRFLENSSKNLYGISIFGSRAKPLGWVFQKSVFAMPQKSNNGDWIRFPEIGLAHRVFQKKCSGNLPRVNIDFFIRWHSFRKSFDTQINFKGSPQPNHFLFEINVKKRRIRHTTTPNLDDLIFSRFWFDLEI